MKRDRHARQQADPTGSYGLLGLSRKWCAQRPKQEPVQERAPVHHWMISSARTRMDCGIVRPRALAVLRLMTSSNFVGCSTGRSAGLAPLRILATNVAAWPIFSARLGP